MRPRTVAGILIEAVLSAALAGCSALGVDSHGADLSQPGPYAVGLTVRPFSRTLPNGETRTFQLTDIGHNV